MTRQQIIEILKTRLNMAKQEGNPTEITFLNELIKIVERDDNAAGRGKK